MLLSLLMVEDSIIRPKWYEGTTGVCYPEDGDLYIPSQPTCNPFYLYVQALG